MLTVGSWNIQSGRGGDLATSTAALGACGVDVLGVQEVDAGQSRSSGVDQTAAVAKALGAQFSRFVPAVVGTPGARWRPATDADETPTATGPDDAPRFGVALVSRLPVRASRVLRLAPSPVAGVVMVPGLPLPVPLRDEPRVVIAADVELDGAVVTVAATHLSFVPGWNVLQLRRTLAWLGASGHPCLLLGDLNLPTPVLDLARGGWRRLSKGPTYPASKPRVALDHVLASGAGWGRPRRQQVRVDVGDHRPVVLGVAPAASSGA